MSYVEPTVVALHSLFCHMTVTKISTLWLVEPETLRRPLIDVSLLNVATAKITSLSKNIRKFPFCAHLRKASSVSIETVKTQIKASNKNINSIYFVACDFADAVPLCRKIDEGDGTLADCQPFGDIVIQNRKQSSRNPASRKLRSKSQHWFKISFFRLLKILPSDCLLITYTTIYSVTAGNCPDEEGDNHDQRTVTALPFWPFGPA